MRGKAASQRASNDAGMAAASSTSSILPLPPNVPCSICSVRTSGGKKRSRLPLGSNTSAGPWCCASGHSAATRLKTLSTALSRGAVSRSSTSPLCCSKRAQAMPKAALLPRPRSAVTTSGRRRLSLTSALTALAWSRVRQSASFQCAAAACRLLNAGSHNAPPTGQRITALDSPN